MKKFIILFLIPFTLISQEDALVEEVIVVGTKASLIAAIDKQSENPKTPKPQNPFQQKLIYSM